MNGMHSRQADAAAALVDERICWRARDDIGDGVHGARCSLGDLELCKTFAGHSELGAAVSTKAIWWDLCLASLLMHLFLFNLLL